ncbi:ribulose-phosphate 3-epimerase [Candidatus Dependentiae bacterium]|nr:ribulose-phosphate 3-epimerase [Candidatus Dependentiae bacterium]
MAAIYPSLISADLLNLEHVLHELNPHVPGYHLDIMDSHFVPNLTWGPAFIDAIARKTHRQLWVHLMVTNPLPWCEILQLPANSIFSFHVESEGNIARIIKKIKEKKWIPSITINPQTAIEKVLPSLEILNHVLLMSVEPGFSGQEFIPSTVEKLKRLNGYRQTSGLTFTIGIDGGINKNNIKNLTDAGANHIAAASAIFNDNNIIDSFKELKEAL